MQHVIGLDLGGTKTAGGLVDAAGELVLSRVVATPSQDGAEAVLAATAHLVGTLVDAAEREGLAPRAIGIGAAGVIDPAGGMVVSATDAIRGWAGTRLTAELTRRTGLPSTALNDVHAHALGESWLGAGADAVSTLFIGMGTGVGGGFVLHGEALDGATHTAGHVGHIASPYAYEDGVPLPCSCGGVGHVESIASGPAIHTHFQRLGGRSVVDMRAVYQLAVTGDRRAIAAVQRGAAAAGQMIGGLANVLDPEVVVVGGGLASAGPLWWEAMDEAARLELLGPLGDLAIVPARLGGTAAIRGAARRALGLTPTTEGHHAEA